MAKIKGQVKWFNESKGFGFITENATHKQNCTSFNPKSVITYNVNYGKPFLNMSRSDAQISIRLPLFLHTYATEYAPIYHCA